FMLGSSVVRRRVWMWIAVGLVGFTVLAVVAILAAVPLTSNALRKRMIETLSKRLDAEVAVGDLTWRVFPTLHASGSNLTIRRRGHADARPLIAVKAFTVDARVAGVVRKHVEHVTVEGLEITIPPDDDTPQSGPTARAAQQATSMEGVVIDTLDADGARVLTIPRNP